MKKGQQAQIFGIIVSIFLVSGIMLFGYSSFTKIKETSEQASLIDFENELNGVIKTTYAKYGNVKQHKAVLPVGFDAICFVDLGNAPSIDQYPLIKDSVDSKTGDNVFLIGKNFKALRMGTEKISYIKNEDDPFICLDSADGFINLRLEGVGRGVKIEAWK